MARHTRAAKVKYRLREIADELIADGTPTVNSATIIDAFNRKKSPVDDKEREEIYQIGLRVVAGQIGTNSRLDKNQYELPLDNNVREFTPILRMSGNKIESSLARTLDLTPDVYFGQPVRIMSDKSSAKPSFRDELESNMNKMRDLGLNGQRYGDYLIRKE
jgi:hypothetical protein